MNIIEILRQIFSATDEQTNAFSAAMKEHGIFTTSHENMDVRYPKLKGEYDTLNTQYGEANKLIEDMKKSTKGQEALQGKITAYEEQLKQAQEVIQKTKIDAAIKIGLLSEKAVDVDYLVFKLNEKLKGDGETLTLDENGDIKGWKDHLDGLKTQFPNMFETTGDGDGEYQVYEPNKLRKPDAKDQPLTKDAFQKMSYEQRMELNEKNPTLYKQLRGN